MQNGVILLTRCKVILSRGKDTCKQKFFYEDILFCINTGIKNNIHDAQIKSFSIACCRDWIWLFSCDPSFIVTAQAMTGRDTPVARPKACLESTKTYGTF